MGEIQSGQDAARQRTPMIRRILAIAACVLVVLGVLWCVAHRSERRVFSVTNLPADGKPAFVLPSKSTVDLGPMSNLPIQKRITGFFLKLKMRIVPPKANPAAYTFAASREHLCHVHGLLSQCTEVTGTRYLLAYEASADGIPFGHALPLNGRQWASAFEQALQANGYEVIREKPNVVKVIPKNLVDEYEKAGLVTRRK